MTEAERAVKLYKEVVKEQGDIIVILRKALADIENLFTKGQNEEK